ncbi:DUF2249 domain-containing protein [Cohnella ginsengisoli]|uniref:DUF2249 domain-containing protein n=1 Tax=Cohnella ginsengisoli TaxID=425004 RepID=A0A9X4KLL2_9BACL|nr:DUF2249 domain-containing protein [Cohnella ginsengisoli]MDG0792677.1 DUF2249 domain-containing protein [Cohnella ginsengisoli]
MDRSAARVVELDVRPHLRKKLEPFSLIMDTVKSLNADEIFVLHATFKPTPLFGVLKMKGLAGKAEQAGKEHWISTFVHKKNKSWLLDPGAGAGAADRAPASDGVCAGDASGAPGQGTFADDTGAQADGAAAAPRIVELDNRGLEPPKPMMRTLAALDRCRSGDAVVIHNDRVPMFLIEELHGLGYPYTVEEQSDGSAKVRIRKP